MRRLIFFWMIIFIFLPVPYIKKNLLETDRAKDIFKDCLFRFHKKFGWMNKEWSIMNHHYQFMSRVPKG